MISAAALPGLAALAGTYHTALIDQFGVLHDGQRAYPGAIDGLKRLHDSGVRIAVLSNSGRRAAPNQDRLAKLGFPPDLYDLCVTSGEVAWRRLADQPAARPRSCFLISRGGDRSPLDGLDLTLTERPEQAELVLIAASEAETVSLEDYQGLLEPAARAGRPAWCLNPDKIMLTAIGPCFGAGRIADLYASLGGTVTWIGKPFPAIYHFALSQLGVAPGPGVIGIGDSIEHDIAGASGVGCHSALILGGIHAGDEPAALEQAMIRHQARPDYCLKQFGW